MIAQERLVGALSIQHDEETATAGFGEHIPLRVDARRAERSILMPCDFGEVAEQLAVIGKHVIDIDPRPLGDNPDVASLVISFDVKTTGHRLLVFLPTRGAQLAVQKADNAGAVEASRQAGADLD